MGEHLKIIEYPLILLFVISGAVFLMSTNDLVSIFLSIELQSYGLYLLSTISLSCTLLYTAIVKILKIYDNSQVTNALSTLVGTSETIRLLNIKLIHSLNKKSNKDLRFIQ